MAHPSRPLAVITGGSRGVGAATVPRLAAAGFDVKFCFRNKSVRAMKVQSAANIETPQSRVDAMRADITVAADRERFVLSLNGSVDVLVLNAAGGMEAGADPEYAELVNADAQLSFLDAVAPLLAPTAVVVFPTSAQSHHYGSIGEFPSYERIARSKYRGEHLVTTRCIVLGITCVVVVSDMIDGSPAALLMDLREPEAADERRRAAIRSGTSLPTAEDVADVITDSALRPGAAVRIVRPARPHAAARKTQLGGNG